MSFGAKGWSCSGFKAVDKRRPAALLTPPSLTPSSAFSSPVSPHGKRLLEMLLPVLSYLSLDDQGGDGNADSLAPVLSSLLSLRSEEIGAKQNNHG